jgi:hypothetical protein
MSALKSHKLFSKLNSRAHPHVRTREESRTLIGTTAAGLAARSSPNVHALASTGGTNNMKELVQ